jgi:hypothetical protein
LNCNGFNFEKAVTPSIYQLARTIDAATNAFTISSQAPWASATGTNRKPGDLVLSVPTPTNGGTTHGKLGIQVAGTDIVKFTKDSSSTAGCMIIGGTLPATVGGIRLNNNDGIYARNAGNTANVTLSRITTDDDVQIGANSRIVAIYNDGVPTFEVGNAASLNGIRMSKPYFSFDPSVNSPIIYHQTKGSDEATTSLRFASQAPWASATGANRKPADIVYIINSPSNGGTTHGKFSFNVAGTEIVSFSKDAAGLGTASILSRNYSSATLTYGTRYQESSFGGLYRKYVWDLRSLPAGTYNIFAVTVSNGYQLYRVKCHESEPGKAIVYCAEVSQDYNTAPTVAVTSNKTTGNVSFAATLTGSTGTNLAMTVADTSTILVEVECWYAAIPGPSITLY